MAPRFPPKPPAPGVRETVAPAIDRSRALLPGEHPMSQQDIVRDLMKKLDLPEGLKKRLRDLHDLQ